MLKIALCSLIEQGNKIRASSIIKNIAPTIELVDEECAEVIICIDMSQVMSMIELYPWKGIVMLITNEYGLPQDLPEHTRFVCVPQAYVLRSISQMQNLQAFFANCRLHHFATAIA